MQTEKILEVILVKRYGNPVHVKPVESLEQLDSAYKNIERTYPPEQGYEILLFNNLKPL